MNVFESSKDEQRLSTVSERELTNRLSHVADVHSLHQVLGLRMVGLKSVRPYDVMLGQQDVC